MGSRDTEQKNTEQRDTELRKAGLKVTLPRIKILAILESSEQRHMSAEDVYRNLLAQGDDVGLATIYRVLTQFQQAEGGQKRVIFKAPFTMLTLFSYH